MKTFKRENKFLTFITNIELLYASLIKIADFLESEIKDTKN
jgi:hypothetical protein